MHTYIYMEIKTTPFNVIKWNGRLGKWRTWLNKLLVGLKYHPTCLYRNKCIYESILCIRVYIMYIFSSIIPHNHQQTPSISFVLYAPCLSVFKGLMDEVFLYFHHHFYQNILYTHTYIHT